jgi:Tol biopolymer transport system component
MGRSLIGHPRGGLRAAAALAGLLACAVAAPSARAASYDPALTWRTLSTPHFRVHFHGGEEALAQRTADIAEPIWAEMCAELGWEPREPIELVLVDNTDSANGYALTVPRNTIVIYVTAPTEDSTLSQYEDWGDTILTHELTHILHIDHVGGLPKALRAVFGRIVSVNRISPGWITEGYATFQETVHTEAGRGRSTIAHMIKRSAVLEDAFPPLGNLEGFQAAPPAGNLRYLFGQDFQQYVAETRGMQAWTTFIHTYGRSWTPWILPGRRSLGAPLPALYREWRGAMTARYEAEAAEIEARGLTPFRVLSDGVDQCAAPTFSPDGARLVWSCSDPATGPAIWLAGGDGEGAQATLDQRFATDFSWRADGAAFAFSSLHLVNRFNVWSDLYFHELGGGVTPLTNGDRARNPAFSPDGTALLAVTQDARETAISRVTVDQRVQVIVQGVDEQQIATPRWSPDGRHFVASVWAEGRRDLWLYAADGAPVRQITADAAHDIDPAWSADGATLFFSSDRTGVFNIYAVDLATEELHQVTEVLGGAFAPSARADGRALVFEAWSNNGMDIAWMDLDRAAWRPRGPIALPMHGPRAPLAAALPGPGFAPVALAPPAPPEGEKVRAPDQQRRFRVRRDEAVFTPPPEPLPVPGLFGLGGPLHGAQHIPVGFGPQPTGDPGLHNGLHPIPPVLRDAPGGGVDVDDPSRSRAQAREEEAYPFTWPVERYRPGPRLAPRFLVPTLALTQFNGLQAGLATAGVDTLGTWFWSAFGSYRTDADFVGWGASVGYNRELPVITAGVFRTAVPFSTILTATAPPTRGGGWLPSVTDSGQLYWEDRISPYVSVAWPVNEYQALYLSWQGERRHPKDPLPDGAWAPSLPTRGFLSSVGGGWVLSRGRAFATSISPEQARTLSFAGLLTAPWLGSRTLQDPDGDGVETLEGFSRLQLTGEWREYRTLPWGRNQVIATRLAGGWSVGDALAQGSFRLGGTIGDSGVYTLPTEYRALRGFPFGAAFGDGYYLGSAEYRLPLWWIDRGVGLVPAFARHLSAAAFVDAGNAFTELSPDVLPGTLIGAGAELRASFILGWALPLTVRVGYGAAVRGDGFAPGDLGGLYAWLGGTF